MDYSVEIRTVEEQRLAAAREQTTLARVALDIGRLLDAPWSHARGAVLGDLWRLV